MPQALADQFVTVPPPPLAASSGYFHVAGADRAKSLDDQLQERNPDMDAPTRLAIVRAIGWMEYRRQGQHLSHVDSAKIIKSARGFSQFLSAKLAPDGRGGSKMSGITILSAKTPEVARAAIARGTEYFLHTGDFVGAESQMAQYVLFNDNFGLSDEQVEGLVSWRPVLDGDESFTCGSCFQEHDIETIGYAEEGAGWPRDVPLCPTCILEVVPNRLLNPYKNLRVSLKLESGEGDIKIPSIGELEQSYMEANPTAIDISTGLVQDAYLQTPLRAGESLCYSTTSALVDPAHHDIPVAVFDCVGPIPDKDFNKVLKHADLKNVVPTSRPLNYALGQDSKHVVPLIALSTSSPFLYEFIWFSD
ncbi:hypothetical protein JCM1840_005831 [Sporobolomyces johnsonii]